MDTHHLARLLLALPSIDVPHIEEGPGECVEIRIFDDRLLNTLLPDDGMMEA